MKKETNKQYFEELINAAKAKNLCARLAVAAAHDRHTLESVIAAESSGLVSPILIGDTEQISSILTDLGKEPDQYTIVQVNGKIECALYAAKLVNEGKADSIMKGKMETGEIMKVMVSHEAGLRTGRAMSLIGFYESPHYHKLFSVTDMGLLTYPDVNQKADAIRNAVQVLKKVGINSPKVAVLTAVEKVNPKMPECLDAAQLKKMNQEGLIKDCIIEGPISYDLAMDPESAAIKGFDSPVAGDADLLVVPNITAGNILVKALTCTGGAKTCGIIVGAKVPLVVTSRSATAEDKYMSIVLASIIGRLD